MVWETPHPDCKARHQDYNEFRYGYIGGTHACAGPECPGCKRDRATAGSVGMSGDRATALEAARWHDES